MPYTPIAGAEERLTGRFLDFGGRHYDLEHPSWGIIWDNAADDGPAINAALDWIGTRGGGIVTLPEGTGRVATGIEMKHFYLRLMGRGGRTVLNYDPASSGSAIKIAAASGPIAYCHVNDFRIITPANAIAKNFLEIVDGSQCAVQDIYCPEGNWDSPGGRFLLTKGREFLRIGPNITFAGEQFWRMDPNPNTVYIGCDHTTIYGPLWLVGRGSAQNAMLTNRPCVEKMPGAPITSFNTVGIVSVNRFSQLWKHKSTDGITTDAGQSYNVNLVGWRREQVPADNNTSLYTIEMDGSGQYLYGLTLDNLHLGANVADGASTKGIKMIGMRNVSMRNIFYNGSDCGVEIGGSCDDVSWQEFFSNQLGAHVLNPGGLLERYSHKAAINISSSIPNRAFYVQWASPNGDNTIDEVQPPSVEGGGVGTAKLKVSIAAGAEYRFPVTAIGQKKVMEVRFLGYGATTGDVYRAVWTDKFGTPDATDGHTQMVGNLGNVAIGNTASKLCYRHWNNSRSFLQNNTTETINGFVEFDIIA